MGQYESTKGPRDPQTAPQNCGKAYTRTNKGILIAEYRAELAAEAELAAPIVPERGPVAAASSGVPRLPRIDGLAENGPRRENKTRESSTGCTSVVSLASFPDKKCKPATRQRKP